MAIVGFGFDNIQAERKLKNFPKDAKISSNINISDVINDEISLSSSKPQSLLKFNFKFSVSYEPDFGLVSLDGHVLYMAEEKEQKEIIDSWKKDKKVKPVLLTSLVNYILAKAHIKSLELTQDVNLPPHLPLPHVQMKDTKDDSKKSEYIG